MVQREERNGPGSRWPQFPEDLATRGHFARFFGRSERLAESIWVTVHRCLPPSSPRPFPRPPVRRPVFCLGSRPRGALPVGTTGSCRKVAVRDNSRCWTTSCYTCLSARGRGKSQNENQDQKSGLSLSAFTSMLSKAAIETREDLGRERKFLRNTNERVR